MDHDELASQLNTAAELVEAAGLPDDLRAVAFAKVLETIMRPAPGNRVGTASNAQTGSRAQTGGTETSDHGDAMARLATKLGIDPATAAKAYDIDEDGLHVVVAPSRLHANVTTAMRQVARLVAAGRQAAGLDLEWTAVSEIRRICEDRGRFSSGHFAEQVAQLDGHGFRLRGSGQARELKANATGFEDAGQLVKELVESD